MYNFGSGMLYGIPTIDVNGAAVTVPTPVQFGIIQDVSLVFTRTSKALYGQKAFPAAVGAGTGKITGQAKYGLINGSLLNLMFGMTPATGEEKVTRDESGTIDAVKYQVTVAGSATWLTDLGVKFGANNAATDGRTMTRVAAAPGPAAGQYSVAAGVYQFAAADTGLNVVISYLLTSAAAPGQLITVVNPYLGISPFYQVVWNGQYQGKQATFTLLRCMFNKLSMATKLEDFSVPELDFEAMADDSDQLLKISTAE